MGNKPTPSCNITQIISIKLKSNSPCFSPAIRWSERDAISGFANHLLSRLLEFFGCSSSSFSTSVPSVKCHTLERFEKGIKTMEVGRATSSMKDEKKDQVVRRTYICNIPSLSREIRDMNLQDYHMESLKRTLFWLFLEAILSAEFNADNCMKNDDTNSFFQQCFPEKAGPERYNREYKLKRTLIREKIGERVDNVTAAEDVACLVTLYMLCSLFLIPNNNYLT